jgi:hypothetical protein
MSPIGQLRVLVGDTASAALQPPMPGEVDYAVFGDDTLATALETAAGNVYRAAGNLYSALAVEYIQQGKSIRTDDLSIDTRTRGADLAKVAASFWEQADAHDAAAGADGFMIIPFAGRAPRHGYIRPEATPHYSLGA